MSKELFAEHFNVSRETLEGLQAYYDLLKIWSKRINLISLTTLDDFWTRHAIDSAQIVNIANNAKSWVDFGTGAGFPGLMIGAILKDRNIDYKIRLIDNNHKRCAFLREGARALGLNVDIQNAGVETVKPEKFDIVTARAFAPLNKLLDYSETYSQLGARLLFLKGEDVQSEIEKASTNWKFSCKIDKSISSNNGCILEVSELSRVNE